MSIGKYSPTVSEAYAKDQDWWKRNGGEDPANKDREYAVYFYDRDGYDSYGYNIIDVDRAGHTEYDYLTTAEWQDEGGSDVYVYTLHEEVGRDWATDENGLPRSVK